MFEKHVSFVSNIRVNKGRLRNGVPKAFLVIAIISVGLQICGLRIIFIDILCLNLTEEFNVGHLQTGGLVL